jgi:hypothetical protein
MTSPTLIAVYRHHDGMFVVALRARRECTSTTRRVRLHERRAGREGARACRRQRTSMTMFLPSTS